jgi:hypothetical protein
LAYLPPLGMILGTKRTHEVMAWSLYAGFGTIDMHSLGPWPARCLAGW